MLCVFFCHFRCFWLLASVSLCMKHNHELHSMRIHIILCGLKHILPWNRSWKVNMWCRSLPLLLCSSNFHMIYVQLFLTACPLEFRHFVVWLWLYLVLLPVCCPACIWHEYRFAHFVWFLFALQSHTDWSEMELLWSHQCVYTKSSTEHKSPELLIGVTLLFKHWICVLLSHHMKVIRLEANNRM